MVALSYSNFLALLQISLVICDIFSHFEVIFSDDAACRFHPKITSHSDESLKSLCSVSSMTNLVCEL